MALDDPQTNPASPRGPLRYARHMAVILCIVLGLALIAIADDRPGWIGLAFIAIAALLFLMGDESLSEISVGPTGLSAKLARVDSKVSKARDDVAELKQVTEELKVLIGTVGRIVFQESGSPNGSEAEAASLDAGGSSEQSSIEAYVPTDPQKNRWGKSAEAQGRRLEAVVTPVDGGDQWFELNLVVESTDLAWPLTGQVRFHLHPTFAQSVVTVDVIGGKASLSRIAWGAFTVGAEVLGDAPPTSLELDLAELQSAPLAFRQR